MRVSEGKRWSSFGCHAIYRVVGLYQPFRFGLSIRIRSRSESIRFTLSSSVLMKLPAINFDKKQHQNDC